MSGNAKNAGTKNPASSTSKKNPRKPLPKLSDAERHKRFLETAHEVGASNDPKDFDEAFDKVVTSKQDVKQKRA
jgi:hypothetical protein